MTLHEPATFITDLLLAALGVWLALRLRREPGPAAARSWWILAIALMAASALVGGFYHGFAAEVPPAVEAGWWRLVLWIICALGFAMGMSLLRELRPSGSPAWVVLLAMKFAASGIAVAMKPEFVVAMVDYGSAMLAWAIAAVLVCRRWCGPLLAGVGLSLLAAVVQQARWGVHSGFNHNDVFHVVQAGALFAFFLAGQRLDTAVTPMALTAALSADED